MILQNTQMTQDIFNKKNEALGLTNKYREDSSNLIIQEMINNGPKMITDMINISKNPSVSIEKDYYGYYDEGYFCIFFVLEFIHSPLYFSTQDCIGGYDSDGVDGIVIDEASDLFDFIIDYEVFPEGSFTKEEAQEAFDYITKLSADIRDRNQSVYYEYLLKDPAI